MKFQSKHTPVRKIMKRAGCPHRELWLVLVLLLTVVGMPGLAANPVFALPPEPIDPDPVGDPEPFVSPVNGFDWSVPSRFGAYANGIINYHWDASTATYNQDYVNPSIFPVNFDACRTADDELSGTSVMTYTWTLRGTTRVSHTCRFQEPFDAQGAYNVSVTINNPDGSVVLDPDGRGNPFTQNVVVKDILVVSLGDSYGSGQGNPDIPQVLGNYVLGQPMAVVQPARWQDTRCHRSAYAPAARAALALEAADPHTSVTFLSFACSGATINRTYYADQSIFDPYRSPQAEGWTKFQGSGILGPYAGAVPPNPDRPQDNQLPSQIDQVVAALTNNGQIATPRGIDALILSGGGNDIGFGNIASLCTLYWDCKNYNVVSADFSGMVPLTTRVQQDIAFMPSRYAALASAINTRVPMAPTGRVYITQYPDSTRNDSGGFCAKMLDDVIPVWMQPLLALASIFDGGPYPPLPPYQIDGDEVVWAGSVVLPGLNAQVATAAQTHGWVLVDGIADASANLFSGHGYCASDSWIRRASEAVNMQGPWAPWNSTLLPPASTQTLGTLHPTAAGYQAVGNRIFAKLSANLLPPPSTTPPTPPSLSAATTHSLVGANGWLTGHDASSSCPSGAANCAFAQETASVDASTAIRGTALRINGAAVDCTTNNVSGVSCVRQLVNAQTYSWEFAFTVDGIYRLEFNVNARNGATTKVNREVKVDLHDPSASADLSSLTPASGWYQSPVTLTLTGRDGSGSGIQYVQYQLDGAATTVGGNNIPLRLDMDGVHSITYNVVDFAGRSNAAQSLSVKIDQSAPTSSAVATPSPSSAGWNNSNVVVMLNTSDSGGSGVASYSYSATGAQSIASTTVGGDTPTQITINTEGVTVISVAATDVAGNNETAKSITIRLDKTAPTVQCSAPDGQWHASDVIIACNATDGNGSGLASSDAVFSLTTNVPANSETTNAATNSRTICDFAGNCAPQVEPISGNKIDKKAPSISITAPASTLYLLGQVVAANYSCSDSGSGVASCVGTVANGANLNTASVGAKTFTVNASDNVGNASSASVNYTVIYNWSGFFQPVDNLPTLNVVKASSAIPVKFSLAGNQGLNIFAAGYPASQPIVCDGSAPLDDVEEMVTAGGSSLSYDATTNQYTYVWKTDNAWTGTCRQLIVRLIDGTEHRANLKFK